MTQLEIRHEWFQSDEFVNISIFYKNLTLDQVEVTFTPTNLTVNLSLPQERTWTLDLDLFSPITVDSSKFTILGTKLEIKLQKERAGLKWASLESQTESVEVQVMNSSVEKPPSYPTSSKKPKDWDKISSSVVDEKPEGDQAVNALFQQIYANGSDEVKKAMMKSFQESGGTCLSTDWNDVGKKKVEVQPPDGMEARRWEL